MKTFRLIFFSLSWGMMLLLSSCVSTEQLTYLQYDYMGYDTLIDARKLVTPDAYEVMPYDNIYIRVITPDPQWSAIFNMMPSQGGMLTQESASLVAYQVDKEGYIDIPYVGRQKVSGKNLKEIKEDLGVIFEKYVTDAALTVKLVNNYVSVVGEVARPGRYPILKDRLNVFEALSMAGDMTQYSNRQEVQLIRPSPDGPVIMEFSLKDRNIISSEYFYVMPNDVIYAEPLKGKTFQMNSSVYSLLLSSVATTLVIIGFFIP